MGMTLSLDIVDTGCRRYTVLDTLNQGSYGIVVLARDSETQSHVAIKCLTKPQSVDSSNDEPCPFYRQELHFHTILAEYDPSLPGDDNVVRCLDAFETSQNAFLVLEYCDLGDLYENIMQGRIPRDTQTVKDMMLQLVNAVQYCHAAGVYHRDIKPENILMSVMEDGSGRPLFKLGDFGLATHDEWTTDVGTGSDRYMAPEQFENIHDGYSPEKADIWAVGCCLLNLVFSRNPFKAPSTSDPIFADYVRDPMSLCDVFPTMSNDTFEVLRHALAIDPTKRDLEKVREAIENLRNWTDSETVDDECPEKVQTDFTCYADEPITCTVFNRAPLRTPSLAQNQPFFSTPVDGTPFPWASALRKPVGTITSIEESEDEDTEYYSDVVDDHETTSIKDTDRKFETDDGRSSDSGLGTSLGSLRVTPHTVAAYRSGKSPHGVNNTFLPTPPSSVQKTVETPIYRPQIATARKVPDVTATPTSSSVPITSGRGILGKYIRESTDKLKFGKSWSDWVEEEEDEEAERMSRGDSRGSTGSSRLSFSETNEDDGDWWEGVPAAHGWED
jgi:serine/threonine protein kinase